MSRWQVKRLKDVAPLQRGFDLTKANLRDGSVPVISSSGFWGFHNKAKVRGPGIVIGRYGTLGEVFFVQEDFWPHNTTLWVTDFCGNDPQFINYLYRSLDISKHSGKTGVPGLNRNDLHTLKIEVPPLPEQRKIAEILSTWDRAIELTEKMISAKQKRKQALMQKLLTGKVRFKEFVKSGEVFSTRYGDYPKDWKYVRIEDIANEVSERNADGTNYQVLSCTKYDGLVDSLTYFGKQIFSKDLSTYKVVRRDQFAYATNHIEEGSIGYQDVCDTALISPMYTVFKTKAGVDDGFLYKLLKSDLYVHIYQVNTSASVDRRGSLRWTAFSHIRIPLPSPDEQLAIASVLDAQQLEIERLETKRETLQMQKKGLMQQLLTGKVRVNVDAETEQV